MQNRLNAHANTFLFGGEAVNATSYLIGGGRVRIERLKVSTAAHSHLTYAVEIEKISPAPISM